MTRAQLIAALSTALGLIGVVAITLYTGVIGQDGYPAPITVDGETITFTWTDNNVGENLHIYTDKRDYTNGLSHAVVYVAVANRSNRNQNVELQALFRDSGKRIKDVSVLANVTQEISEPVFTEQCNDIVGATSTNRVCTQTQTGTTTRQENRNVWAPLSLVQRTAEEITKENTIVSPALRKSVENFIGTTKTVAFPVNRNEVVYYKVHIEFPAGSEDNFYFEAFGSDGAYGHLDPWFNSSWQYRFKVEVNRTRVGTTSAVTNFPVYFDLAGASTSFWSNVKSDGSDIRVVESDETTETAFELVSISTTTRRGELHFMADSLATTSTSTFYIYYGNSGATAYASTSLYGSNNVWTGYMAVYHMQSNANDSTSNARNGVSTSVTYATGGQIGSRGDFVPALNSGLNISGLNAPTGTSSKSFTFWHNTDTVKRQWYIAQGTDASNQAFGLFLNSTAPSDTLHFFGNGGGNDINYGTGQVTAGAWAKITITYDGTNVRYYKNGILVNTTARTLGTTNTSAGTLVGNRKTDETNSRYDGKMDEIRFMAGAWSQAWEVTEYNNQSSTSTFFVVGPQETDTPAGGGTTPQDMIIMAIVSKYLWRNKTTI